MSVTSVCAYGSVTMYEMSWIGEPKVGTIQTYKVRYNKINVFYFQEMSSGNSWAVYCRESEKDRSKMEVDFLSI